MTVDDGKVGSFLVVTGLGRLIAGVCGTVISGLIGGSKLVGGLVFCSGETLHRDWILTGELWICQSDLSSELDSARCFPLSVMGLVSSSEFGSSASFSDFDGGSLSPS